ncbi:MAG: Nif3-like dinuclear metal center hexameric protein [Clostridiales bacterium]
MNLNELLQELNRICPFNIQEDFDNCGLQVGNGENTCTKALLAFDFTEKIADEAIEKKADVIITHHPFLFHGIKNVATSNWQGKMIYKLIENNIALIALHTNLDKIDYGVNMTLGQNLNLKNLRTFLPEENQIGLGAVGETPKTINFGEFTDLVKNKLSRPGIKFVGDPNTPINKVAVLGGAGAEFLSSAKTQKADVYISSDFKYHDAQLAQNIGICIIDAGHFGTEVGVVEALAKKLNQEIPHLKIEISTNMEDYWQYK